MTNSANIALTVLQPGSRTAGGNSYEDLVIFYWNWLLGPDSDLPAGTATCVQTVGPDTILFMRACYEYFFNISTANNTVRRQNSQFCRNVSNNPVVNVQTTIDPSN
jgi:hypothetical protein